MEEKPSATVVALKGWPLHRSDRGISDQAVLVFDPAAQHYSSIFIPVELLLPVWGNTLSSELTSTEIGKSFFWRSQAEQDGEQFLIHTAKEKAPRNLTNTCTSVSSLCFINAFGQVTRLLFQKTFELLPSGAIKIPNYTALVTFTYVSKCCLVTSNHLDDLGSAYTPVGAQLRGLSQETFLLKFCPQSARKDSHLRAARGNCTPQSGAESNLSLIWTMQCDPHCCRVCRVLYTRPKQKANAAALIWQDITSTRALWALMVHTPCAVQWRPASTPSYGLFCKLPKTTNSPTCSVS